MGIFFFAGGSDASITSDSVISGSQSLSLVDSGDSTASVYRPLVNYDSIYYKVRIDSNDSDFDSGFTDNADNGSTPLLLRFDSDGNIRYLDESDQFSAIGSYSVATDYFVELQVDYSTDTWDIIVTDISTGSEVVNSSSLSFASGEDLLYSNIKGFYAQLQTGGGRVVIDDIMSDEIASFFETNGFFESRIYNCGGIYNFSDASFSANIPANTSIELYTRTSTDGLDFSQYQPVSQTGWVDSPRGGFLQLRCDLTSSDGLNTPTLEQITAGIRLLGDINRDSFVNSADLEYLCNQWLLDEPSIDADISPVNGNSQVDFKDFAVLSENWQK